ncbi:RNA polymerase sigma factor region1.1 domain-containing protein [Anaeromyxobacter oryzisoli]|uniref:RNA polymerase sigma factor region1.1 domain-containing protein n=1 Tax=Anaeromyxobacter oryzisoli TaxID=2925408 RepID=UPI001F57FAC8|nr:RNA polymerase sigma factor region1.1 domain-containing protein [Anaeromyxobacter sp. SG63]
MRHGSESHEARKALFQLGIRRGYLTLSEIDRALPAGSLSPAERWLLFYSLRAAGVELRDDHGDALGPLPGGPPAPDHP